jgi:predicted DNA-binding transcriptional regulator YafY
MKSSRLIALLLRLQSTGSATAAALAEALEVSVRTVYRDVAALQAAGVPLWTEPGRNGGIRLVDGWRTRLDGLTGDEAAALFLAGVPRAAGELGLSTVLVAAQEKVLATLPAELRGRAGRIRERFHLDAPGWFHHDEPVPHLGTVAAAVWGGRQLAIRYRARTRDVQRQIEPLGLVLKAGTWYLVAMARGDIRTYRVGRIVAADATGGAVTRPDGFDLATWWAASSREFGAQLRTFHCRLRVSPWGLRMLPYVVDADAGQDALDAAGPPDNDGWREVVVATESVEVAADQLSGLGAGVEVLEPVALRRRLAAIGAAMAARNAEAPAARGS